MKPSTKQELIKKINKKYSPERKKEMEDKPPDDMIIDYNHPAYYEYVDPPNPQEIMKNIEETIKEQTLSQVLSLIKVRIDHFTREIEYAKISTGYDYPILIGKRKEFEKLLDLVQGIR